MTECKLYQVSVGHTGDEGKFTVVRGRSESDDLKDSAIVGYEVAAGVENTSKTAYSCSAYFARWKVI